MPRVDRLDKIGEAISWLERRSCYLAAGVMRLGVPAIVDGAGTASVGLHDGRLALKFDPAWVDELTVGELVGVLLHEAMHVIHRHVFVQKRFTSMLDSHLYNVACDAVVNDLIEERCPNVILPDPHVTGLATIGRSTVGATAEEVFQELRERPTMGVVALLTTDRHEEWPGLSRAASPSAGGPVGGALEDEHEPERKNAARDAEIGEQELELAVERLVARYAATDRSGDVAAELWRPIAVRRSRPGMEQVLRHVVGSICRVDTVWAPRPRRLMSFPGGAVLPSYPAKDVRRVLIAVDSSGSIAPTVLSLLVAISRSPLPGCSVEIVSFDTVVYRLSDTGSNAIKGGGGTSFRCIEEHALRSPSYPDAILVLTDGRAPRPRISKPERWTWLVDRESLPRNLAGLGRCLCLRGERRLDATPRPDLAQLRAV